MLMHCLLHPVEQFVAEETEIRRIVEICKMTTIRSAVRPSKHPADAEPQVGSGKDGAEETVLG